MRKKNILCVISARGGSMGLKNKNIKFFLGKPLIAWSILQAKKSKFISDVYISTDSKKIAQISEKYGAKVSFMRSKKLASSKASKFNVWKNAFKILEKKNKKNYDFFLDLDCTNPLRKTNDIDGIISSFKKKYEIFDALITITKSRKNPYFNMLEKNISGYLQPSKYLKEWPASRQVTPKVYDQVASMYILNTSFIRKSKNLYSGKIGGYLLREYQNFDIDSDIDLLIIKNLFKKFYNKIKL